MKNKIYIFASILILMQSVLCGDLSDDARYYRRNSRRINGRNKLDKAVHVSLLGNEKDTEHVIQTTIAKNNSDYDDTKVESDLTVSNEDTKNEMKNKELTLLSEIPTKLEIEQKGGLEFPENNNLQRSGKRKRLIEVRKTKVNKNDDNFENSFNEPDKKSYVSTRTDQRKPDWAIPKKHQQSKPEFRIVDMENYVYSNRGEFRYSYESADGTKAYERGQLKSLEDNSKGTAVFGGFSYKGKDGEKYNLQYTADENGYRPVGDHLPTPPPIPPEIARALFYLATKSVPPLPSTEEPIKYDYDYY